MVTDGIHDRFVAAVRERLSRWTTGDARGSGVDMGPVVDPSQLEQDLRYLEVARAEGGEPMNAPLFDDASPLASGAGVNGPSDAHNVTRLPQSGRPAPVWVTAQYASTPTTVMPGAASKLERGAA